MPNSVIFSERETIKSPASVTAQLGKLKSRGLIIEDEKYAYSTLETVNYYRLIHYFAFFLDDSGQYYREGISFNDGMRLYHFDRKLRAVILSVLEEIEVAIRAGVSNFHAHKYEAQGYLNGNTFERRHNHKAFLSKIERMLDKNAHLAFVKHYQNKHKGKFPLWVMMEMFSFGMLVFFYQDMKNNDKKEVAERYFKIDSRNAENWFENLANLRNHCAHYNRVYGNDLPGDLRKVEIIEPREYEMQSDGSPTLFDYLLIIKMLHRRGNEQEDWGKSFVSDIGKLFDEYSDIAHPTVLGFPEDWVNFFV
ncbi:MAG: Abi family protein [Oscillospiraceae bacterium]|nr:Abi family protein [Oscillospiraceae bacterium]